MYKLIKTTFTTNEIVFTQNFIDEGQFKFIPKLTRIIVKINDNNFYTDLILKINNTDENPFPVNIKISFRAIFEFNDIDDQKEVELFLKIQAVHIMYPYLRSMLTNLTNTAMMPPLILPIIDASQIFKNGDNDIRIN